MHGLRHPYSGALYEPLGERRVQVTQRDGKVAVFAADGRWVSGDKIGADPQLTGWVAADRGIHRMAEK
ncbi:hypothetical protein R1X32_01470 (plasmid) [Rhodococcus opacus]|jgi:hypothetical protein|uniref:Transposase n=1 Tax=Rhodococcus opacus TaxID=37919 RepID=A0AAX3YSX3_RHOOP|nr:MULTISPECIES: transposase [Rhodococcus]NHU45162.1 transposase [Rhodococcus sp. A14]MCZ4588777.1 hypothetical protein [Rhodococcus opacus]QSE85970.1 hypothetical protein JWS14_43660 [Rhodococcus koreensis]UZG59808.1 hypothetical protein ONE62_39360 [Rhodococcus opacus]WKN61299.1 hypothetical protein HJ581_0047825 [Rhodococcus opacus]